MDINEILRGNDPHGGANSEAFGPPPPPYSVGKLPGYENVTSDNAIVSPPTAPDAIDEEPLAIREMPSVPQFTEEDVREAVTRLASDHCCYGGTFVREMEITEITMQSAFRYTFETFGEKRESGWRFVPYAGEGIDGPTNGPAPAAWDIPVNPQVYFKGSQVKKEVPHTAFVKPCHTCVGNGRIRCEICQGRGWRSGARVPANRCSNCSRTGQIRCTTCQGRGNMRGFVELIVTWKNHVTDYVAEVNIMPKEVVREGTGKVIIQEEMPRVRAITNSADQAVNNVSKSVVAKHSTGFPNEQILRQRHLLQIVPIASCTYKWKERIGNFCVYGYEHKVYFPDYPQKYCCGCSIL